MPYTRWSLAKLSRYLHGQRIAVMPAHLGRILARKGISLQRTRSWKQSPDPDYEAKCCTRSHAVSRETQGRGGDQLRREGAGESLPHPRPRLARRGRPERHRATFNRRQGIRYLVGALDVHADYLRIRARPRRDGTSTLTFIRQIRLAYPRQQFHLPTTARVRIAPSNSGRPNSTSDGRNRPWARSAGATGSAASSTSTTERPHETRHNHGTLQAFSSTSVRIVVSNPHSVPIGEIVVEVRDGKVHVSSSGPDELEIVLD